MFKDCFKKIFGKFNYINVGGWEVFKGFEQGFSTFLNHAKNHYQTRCGDLFSSVRGRGGPTHLFRRGIFLLCLGDYERSIFREKKSEVDEMA